MPRHARSFLLLSLLLLGGGLVPAAQAHGGEDHGDGAATATASGAGVLTTSVLTRRYEIVLKHAPVRGGQPYAATLYLAYFETNLPVRGAQITVEEPGATDRPFVVHETNTPGVYRVDRKAGFARDGRYSVTVRVAASAGPDLALVPGVFVGPVEAPQAAGTASGTAEGPAFPWIWMLIVGLLGAAFALWLVWSARKRRTHEASDAAMPPPTSSPPAGSARASRPAVREPAAP